MDGLDIVSIRIEHERPVVLTGVLRSHARSAVVPASRGKRGCMERVDLLAPVRGERHVDRGRGWVNGRDGEVGSLLKSEGDLPRGLAPGTDLGEPEGEQRPRVELAAAGEVAHADTEMVDHHAPPRHIGHCNPQPT